MSKISEQKALKAYPTYYFFEKREGYIAGYDQAMQNFKTAYVVTRSDLHYDEVEKVFFDKSKAEEYCKPYNEDENSYHRNITKIEVTL